MAETSEAGQPAAGQVTAPEAEPKGTEAQAPEGEAAEAPKDPKGPRLAGLLEEPKDEEPEPPEEPEDPKPKGRSRGAPKVEPVKAEDIVTPEGMEYDAAVGTEFLGVLNDGKLSRKEMAQKLVAMHAAQMSRMMEALAANEAEQVKAFEADMAKERGEWLKQCQADEEFGGQRWEAAQAVIDRGCKQLATPAAVELMQRYNLNTHPEIVRMFYRAGKLAGEDRGALAGAGGGKADPAEAIFGESLRNWKRRGAGNDG